jgi:hypothetical protein
LTFYIKVDIDFGADLEPVPGDKTRSTIADIDRVGVVRNLLSTSISPIQNRGEFDRNPQLFSLILKIERHCPFFCFFLFFAGARKIARLTDNFKPYGTVCHCLNGLSRAIQFSTMKLKLEGAKVCQDRGLDSSGGFDQAYAPDPRSSKTPLVASESSLSRTL